MIHTGEFLAIFCADDDVWRRLDAVTPRLPLPARRVRSWGRFQALAPAARCAIVHIPWLEGSRDFAALKVLMQTHPLLPIVLVTERHWSVARRPQDILIDEVVWARDLEVSLEGAVLSTLAVSWRDRVARTVRQASHVGVRLRRALVEAIRQSPPPRTVQALAAIAGCDRRTLWENWRASEAPGTPKVFIEWLLLVSAVEQKRPGKSWATVARELAMTPRTVTRLMRKLTGIESRRDLAMIGLSEILQIFVDEFVQRFQHDTAPDRLAPIRTDPYLSRHSGP